MGKLALEEVQARLEADLFLSSLTESGMPLLFLRGWLIFNLSDFSHGPSYGDVQ